jgi:hypothetical protein
MMIRERTALGVAMDHFHALSDSAEVLWVRWLSVQRRLGYLTEYFQVGVASCVQGESRPGRLTEIYHCYANYLQGSQRQQVASGKALVRIIRGVRSA